MAAKLPLENHPLERAAIGAFMKNTDEFWRFKSRARPDLFTVVMHGKIIKLMHTLTEEGRELTLPAIMGRLGQEDDGRSDFSVEGYLATLVADEAEPEALPDIMVDLESMFARRQMAKLGAELIRQATEDNGLDPASRIEAAQADLLELGDPLNRDVRHIGDVAQGVLDRVSAAADAEEPVGLDLGLKGLQDIIGPLMPGRVYLIAGPPGSGKSALAQQVGEFIGASKATDGSKLVVMFESLEMETDELAERAMASDSGITADRIERAALNNAEVDRLADSVYKLASSGLYLSGGSNVTIAKIRAKAMRLRRMKKRLDALLIDHLLYIELMDRRKGEFEGIRANMQGVKKLAKDLGIPVILLAQLKASFGDGTWQQIRRPVVGDIYGGSAPEQESDVVLLVHREEYLLLRKKPDEDAKDYVDWGSRLEKVRGKAELIVAKRRGGAGHGIRTVYFDGPRTKFSDQAPPFSKSSPDFFSPSFTKQDLEEAQGL